MALVKTAVLLFGSPGTGNLKHDRLWYDGYFFHPSYGQAGFWSVQTNGQRVLYGQVFDWIADDNPSPDFSSRMATANMVINKFEEDRGVDFRSFDVVVVVLGIPAAMKSDGGSTTGSSADRKHNALVIRVGDPFDFVAHELGHALGLKHSFGTKPIPVVGENPGGYGHPFCIMSARFYGNTAASYAPPMPRDNAPEYSGLGPSLNGLTARANGWIDVHSLNLAVTAQADFSIRSRQWLGAFPTGTPQGLEILSPDGSSFLVDFYEPRGWDLARPGPAVVLTQGKGGRAETSYPTQNSGTYISHVQLPVTFGGPGAAIHAAGFTVTVLDYQPATHEVRVRVNRGPGPSHEVGIDWKVETLTANQVGTGVTTWERGEALCLTGTWPYRKLAYSQEAKIDATYDLGSQGMSATWSIEGAPLPATAVPLSGTLTLAMRVRVAHPKFTEVIENRLVPVQYFVEPLPNGSRLRLRNRPQDESFKVRIEVTLSNSWGSGSAISWVPFKGQEFVYEPAFYEARDACFAAFIDVGKRYRPYRVVPFPQLWEQIEPRQLARVSSWLDALAEHRERDETRLFEQGSLALARELDVPDLGLQVLSVSEAFAPPLIDRVIAPPASPDFTEPRRPESPVPEGPGNRGASWGSLVIAAAIGAVIATAAMLLLR